MRSARRICLLVLTATLLGAVSACQDSDHLAGPLPTPAPIHSTDPNNSNNSDNSPVVDPSPVPVPTTPSPTPTPVISIPGTFRTDSILALDGANSDQRTRIGAAMWKFSGGTFTFDSTNVSGHLFPVTGRYSVSGTTVTFHASNSFGAGTGFLDSISVDGTLDLLTADVSFTVDSNAFGSAVVDGQANGSNESSVVQGQVEVKPGPAIGKHYTGPEPGSYPVTLRGSVDGNSFTRSATLYVASSAGGNSIDVCLISGFPMGAPEVGAIRFVSNTTCFPGASKKFDMGSVTVSGSTVTVQADPSMEPTGMNQFTDSGSVFACPFFVDSGSMRVTVAGGRVTGSIDVGSDSCGPGRYQAQFSS